MKRPSAVTVVLIPAASALVINLITNTIEVPPEISTWPWITAAALVAVAIHLEIRHRRLEHQQATGRTERDAIRMLATSVSAEVEQQERHRRLIDPRPIPVPFETLGPPLSDHWPLIRSDRGNRKINLDSTSESLAKILKSPRIRGRLVVIGEPGSGKTAALIKLTADLLTTRGQADPVPIYLRLATWDPHETTLEEWVHHRIWEDYGVAPRKDRQHIDKIGRNIPIEHLVLILDGLDEMADIQTRILAISTLRNSLQREAKIVVSCRREEYVETFYGSSGSVLTGAAVLELQPLRAAEIERYLTLSTPPLRASTWRSFFAADSSGIGREALSAPLWISLARAAYADSAEDPAAMLRFETSSDIQLHLLDRLIVAKYLDPPVPGSDGLRWQRHDAQRWFGFLASHIRNKMGTHDIAWWHLAHAVPRTLAERLMNRVVGGLIGASMYGLAFGLFGYSAGLAMSSAKSFGPTDVATATLSAGAGFAAVSIATYSDRRRTEPVRVKVGILRPSLTVTQALTLLAIGVVTGFAVNPEFGALLTFALFTVAFLASAHKNLFEPSDVTSAPSPSELLKADIKWTIASGLIYGIGSATVIGIIAGGITGFIAQGDSMTLASTLSGAIAGTLAGGIVTLNGGFTTAVGEFYIAKLYLCRSGHVPYRYMEFLSDAHKRGVLRQVGGVYQFMHATLRDRLADQFSETGRESRSV